MAKLNEIERSDKPFDYKAALNCVTMTHERLNEFLNREIMNIETKKELIEVQSELDNINNLTIDSGLYLIVKTLRLLVKAVLESGDDWSLPRYDGTKFS